MANFTPWESSAEYVEAKKIVDDVFGRITTLKADTQRIVPKVSTYKKATLENLIKEAEAGYDVARAKNQEYGRMSPEVAYARAVAAQSKELAAKILSEAQSKAAALKTESDRYSDAAMNFSASGGGKGGGTQGIHFRLIEAYKEKMKVLKKELEVAAKENGSNPNRKV